MAPLPETLRRRLENTIVKARDMAEDGVRAALERLAVGEPEPFATMSPVERDLRVRLRAHALQLCDPRSKDGRQEIERLISECAYEHWHRMLFARFLAENRLLIHSEHGVPVTLAECEELAAEEGEEDGWVLAGRFAARMLPAIFRPDDPVLSVRLASEHQQPLEKLLTELPVEVFTADDGLGWVYQFWQTKRKKAINQSEIKIGADELPAVTQLFTEPYMVHFLLHNTLGAWWAGKVLAAQPELAETAASEEELRAACALPGYSWSYLRFIRVEESSSWSPAAGVFDSWPDRAAEITVLDPCCGSGHFLVEAFRSLVSLRRTEEGLSAREACEAVLRDNLFGLEIDERCTQIAAFNLALAAWACPEASGYRPLPEIHVACSGLSVGAKEEEWLKLAGKDERLRGGMRQLYNLFKDAPILGSLIDPRRELEPTSPQVTFNEVAFDELRPLVERALAREEVRRDAQTTEAGIAAQGVARAAALLADLYTLVITNVPYLGYSKQAPQLKEYAERNWKLARHDLSTTFLLRCRDLALRNGVAALVLPQSWTFLVTYSKLRQNLLTTCSVDVVVRLGPAAFQGMNWWAATTSLVVLSRCTPGSDHKILCLDASATRDPSMKGGLLLQATSSLVSQAEQLNNPDYRILCEGNEEGPLLSHYADSLQGVSTADMPRFSQFFWEASLISSDWSLFQGSLHETVAYGGREAKIAMLELDRVGADLGAAIRGRHAWGRLGVVVRQMRHLPACIYTGEPFDTNVAVILPKREENMPAVWAFCSSPEFHSAVRRIDQKTNVTNATLVKVPFSSEFWQKVAADRFPKGLPEPESDDPTQWLFHGRPDASTSPLQVGVARLMGYRWPAELDETIRLSNRARELVRSCDGLLDFSDADGIFCIPPIRGELPAANQLQSLLAQAFGAAWTPNTLPGLLAQAGFPGKTLENWLRDGFFEEHYQLFYHRPFIWHIWDGRYDGFAALVNYHKLDRKLLERLTYTVLGDWITDQRQGVNAGELGAEERLAAAETLKQKLALILEGEPPYDIFVRWKALKAQPIGWEPDFNDGVRMNIRPFVKAGVLRKEPRIKWTRDRGAEPQSPRSREEFPWFWKDGRFTGKRVNDIHLTNAAKRAARAAVGK